MILYSIRRGPRGHTITKFDDDLNPVASYDVSVGSCTCPAGPRPTCRHRKMLARMLPKTDTDSFYCYETQTWHRPFTASEASGGEVPVELEGEARSPGSSVPLEPEPVVAEALGSPSPAEVDPGFAEALANKVGVDLDLPITAETVPDLAVPPRVGIRRR